MKQLMAKLIAEGRSTPGATQKNDVEVTICDRGKPAPAKKKPARAGAKTAKPK